jgi:hypothetical protein
VAAVDEHIEGARGGEDAGIDQASREFFFQVEEGRFELVTSNVVADELVSAPERVRLQFETFLPSAHLVVPSSQALALQQAYLQAGIVTAKWATDALHCPSPCGDPVCGSGILRQGTLIASCSQYRSSSIRGLVWWSVT